MDDYCEKVAFVYPSRFIDTEGLTDLPSPELVYEVNEFPNIKSFFVNFGLANMKDDVRYSIDINAYFEGKLLTEANVTVGDFIHRNERQSKKGAFMSTLTLATPSISLPDSGTYKFVVEIFDGVVSDKNKKLLHSNECYFIVSDEWEF